VVSVIDINQWTDDFIRQRIFKKVFLIRKKVVRLWPDWPDHQLRPCTESWPFQWYQICELWMFYLFRVNSCVTFAEWALLSFHSVCLDVCRSFRNLQPTTIDRSQPNLVGGYLYTCPRSRVSLFGSSICHTLGARGKNMQNFAYLRVFLPLRTWRIVPS